MLNNISIRKRLTLITASILIIVSIVAGFFSLYSAEQSMFKPAESFRNRHYGKPSPRMKPSGPKNEDFRTLIENSRNQFRDRVVISMIALIILGSAIIYYFAGKALKPLSKLSNQIKNIDEHNLNQKLDDYKTNDEITSLTTSFNSMLEKLNKAFESQKRFSQNAAHELKTPLTTIMTNIEVLEMDDKPTKKEYKEVVGITKDSTERLIQLVDSLLKVTNKEDYFNEEIDLVEMFDEILLDLDSLINDKKVNVRISGYQKVYADKTLLQRAFSNLVSNAIRYNNEDGNVNIIIKNEEVVISDDGFGIEDKQLNDIFEPFYCVDDSRSKDLGGTGLGLSIVKEIFDQYELKYRITSKINEGSSVIVNIKPIESK